MSTLLSRYSLFAAHAPPALQSARAIVTCLALAVLLVLLPSNAFGQVILDGVDQGATYSNFDTVGRANVNSGGNLTNENADIGMTTIGVGVGHATMNNRGNTSIGTAAVWGGGHMGNWDNASIGAATVWGGHMDNWDNASVGLAAVWSGTLSNRGNATIREASILSGSGTLNNAGNATIGEARISSGTLNNEGNATVETTSISSGTLNNAGNATIREARIFSGSGTLNNTDNATVETANISSGTLNNAGNATVGTADISGGRLDNAGNATVETANISSGTLSNRLNGIVETAYISGGTLTNINSTVGTAHISGGRLLNSDSQVGTSTVGTANITGGTLDNYSGAVIGTVLLDGGMVNNIGRIDNLTYIGGTYNWRQIEDTTGFIRTGIGTIGTLTFVGEAPRGMDWGNVETTNVHGGTMHNEGSNIITTLHVNNGGMVYNLDDATVVTANVNSGTLYNRDDAAIGLATVSGVLHNTASIGRAIVQEQGTLINEAAHLFWESGIGSVDLLGGTFENGGSVGTLTHFGGTYIGEYQGRIGTVGRFIVGGDLDASNNLGIIENLEFASNGSGLLSISGFADDGFAGINVTESVNLAYGNIELNLTGTVNDWLFGESRWDDIFGGALVNGWETASFSASWADGNSTDWLAFGQTWDFGNGLFVAFGSDGMTVTPEPATLAMVGLGLVGLGLARRRQMRKATAA